MFPVFREMNKVSERPGLGAEPVAVSAGFHLIGFSIMRGFCYLDILLSFFFFFFLAKEEEGACRLGPCHLQTSSTQGHVCTVQGT